MLQYHWKWQPQQDTISVLKPLWPPTCVRTLAMTIRDQQMFVLHLSDFCKTA